MCGHGDDFNDGHRSVYDHAASEYEKLMLSLALGGASLYSEDFEKERHSGGGFSGQLGWGFTRLVTLLVDASGDLGVTWRPMLGKR